MEMREEGGEHYYSADEADGVAEERCCEARDEGGEVEGCVAWHLGGFVPLGSGNLMGLKA